MCSGMGLTSVASRKSSIQLKTSRTKTLRPWPTRYTVSSQTDNKKMKGKEIKKREYVSLQQQLEISRVSIEILKKTKLYI